MDGATGEDADVDVVVVVVVIPAHASWIV